MNILIDGAGIAGLAAAVHLKKRGHQITVIEKAKDWKQQGYVLGVWSSLTYLGDEFIQKMAARGLASQKLTIADREGKTIRTWERPCAPGCPPRRKISATPSR